MEGVGIFQLQERQKPLRKILGGARDAEVVEAKVLADGCRSLKGMLSRYYVEGQGKVGGR